MSHPEHPAVIEEYRPYLRVLAEFEIAAPLRRRIDPSDLVQETLLKACSAAKKDPDSFREQDAERRAAWLRKILANTVANVWRYHRAARRNLFRERSFEELIDQSSIRLGRLLAAGGPSPSQCAVHAERALELARALTRLPEDQRRAVILQRIRGLPIAAIAQELGRTKDAVAGLVRRGLQRLETELEEGG